MRPTRLSALVALVVLTGVAAYLLTRAYYADVPSPPVFAPVWLLLLAIAEGYTAYTTSARLSGAVRTRPINPIVVARLAALAKATSLVAALATGAYAGFLGHVAVTSGPQAHTDTRTAIAGAACGLALGVAALVLERVCRANPPEDDPEV